MPICKSKESKRTQTILILQQYQESQAHASEMVELSKYHHSETFKKVTAGPWLINLIMVLYRLESQAIDFNFIQLAYSTIATVM